MLTALPLVAALSCDLDEVTVGQGQPFLVVQSVVMTDAVRRIVIVEESLSGDAYAIGLAGLVPPNSPNLPVEGATVGMRNLDLDPDPCGAPSFQEGVPIVGGIVRATPGVYHSAIGCPTVRPGDRLELRVTAGPAIVVGETRVPDFTGGTVRVGATSLPFGTDTFRLNRDRDSLVVTADGAGIRGVYVIVQGTGYGPPGSETSTSQASVAPQPTPSLETFGDSGGIALPGNIRHTFFRGTGEPTFVGGRRYRVVVAAMDTNYFQALATEANRLTGRGYANRLTGGVGVFGSMVPRTIVVEAVADQEDSREGVYAIAGTVNGVDVSVTVDIYLTGTGDSASAFFSGDWLQHFTVMGWQSAPVVRQAVNGVATADSLHFEVVTIRIDEGPVTRTRLFRTLLVGARSAGQPFTVTVSERLATGELAELGTLTAVQQ